MNILKLYKGALAACALLLGSSMISNASAALPLEGVTLNAGFSVAPPFVIVKGTFADLAGIDIDILKELQRRTGFKIANSAPSLMNFADLMKQGNEGKVDIIGGGIYMTEERAKTYDFTGPTYRTSIALVTSKNSNIRNFQDLNGKVVSAEAGTTADDVIPEGSGIHVTMKNMPTNFMAMFAVARGMADAVITDAPLAEEYIGNWPESNLKIQMLAPNSQANMALLLKKGTHATRVLQDTYREMQLDGTVDRIVQKYTRTFSDLAASHLNRPDGVVANTSNSKGYEAL